MNTPKPAGAEYEPLAEEFSRLVNAYENGERQQRQEAWNLIADFCVENKTSIAAMLAASPRAPDAGVIERAAKAILAERFGPDFWDDAIRDGLEGVIHRDARNEARAVIETLFSNSTGAKS